MRKALVLSAVLIASLCHGWAYFRTWTGSVDDGRDIVLCADGGYLMTGRSNNWAVGGYSYNPYDYEAFLIKVDANGEHLWSKHFGQNGYFLSGSDVAGYYDAGWSLEATPDSGCLIVGKSQSPNYTVPYTGMPDDCIGYDNLLLVRVDKNGDTLWTKGYGGYYFDRGWWVKTIPGTTDFFIVGTTHDVGPGTPDETQSNIWVLRIDKDGYILAENAWGVAGWTSDGRWGALSSDGGVVAAGCTHMRDTTYTDSTGTAVTRRISDATIVKFDSELNLVWSRTYPSGYDSYTRGIAPYPGGGYLVSTYSGYPAKTWVWRVNEDGDTLWTGYVGVDSTTGNAYANYNMVINAPDGGFYFAGSGRGYGQILHVDQNLNFVWEAEYDFGSATELFLSCKLTPDGGVAAVGQTYSLPPAAYTDIYAVRCNADGTDYMGIKESRRTPTLYNISAYPNPFNASVEISFPANNATVEILDIAGKVVFTSKETHFKWQPEHNVPSGMYFVRATGKNFSASKSILFIK